MSRALKNLQINFELYWYLAQNFRINEKTIGFQGRHKDKLRITFKYAGVVSKLIMLLIVDTRTLSFIAMMTYLTQNIIFV